MSSSETGKQGAGARPEQLLRAIQVLAMDVDGVLTDGSLDYGPEGERTKRFHVADGIGIQLVRHAGIRVIWITGRGSDAVRLRAQELGIDDYFAACQNKAAPLAELLGKMTLASRHLAYIGDDLNDLPAFSVAGVRFAPANAVTEIKAAADFITERPGGSGAVREVCDVILKAKSAWNKAAEQYLASLVQS